MVVGNHLKEEGEEDRDEEDEEEEEEPSVEGTRVAVWGRYLAWHARRQLAFDMWWLGLALFLVCIIERSKLQDVNNFSWFTIFAVSEYISLFIYFTFASFIEFLIEFLY